MLVTILLFIVSVENGITDPKQEHALVSDSSKYKTRNGFWRLFPVTTI